MISVLALTRNHLHDSIFTVGHLTLRQREHTPWKPIDRALPAGKPGNGRSSMPSRCPEDLDS